MDTDFITKIIAGLAAAGTAAYAAIRMFKSDRRDDKVADLTDDMLTKVIATLREEVDRLSARLEKVEAQNRACEAMNESMHLEILELKKQMVTA